MATAASEQIGVPRRFAIGTLLVLSTMYAVLFRALAFLGFDTTVVGVIALFCTMIGIAQVVLFRGQRPREASFAAGFLAAPCLLMICFVASRLGAVSLNPYRLMVDDWLDLLAVMGLLAVSGIGFGYLAGCCAAGVFFVMDRYRKNFALQQPTYEDRSIGWDERLYDRCAGLLKWLFRINRNPAKAALFAFLLLCLFFAPSLSFARFTGLFWQYFWIAVGLLFLLPLLFGGVMRYQWLPTIVAAILGAVGSWPISIVLSRSVIVANWPDLPRWAEIVIVAMLGAGVGIVCASIVGWMHWVCFRREPALPGKRTRIAAMLLVIVALIGLGAVAHRFASSPMQITLKSLRANGGGAYARVTVPDAGQSATDLYWTEEQRFTRQDARNLALFTKLRTLAIYGPIEPSALLELQKCQGLTFLFVQGTAIPSDDLSNLPQNLTTTWLANSGIDDEALKHLAKLPRLTHVNLQDTDITDQGLQHLGASTTIQQLTLNRCNVTGAGLAKLSQLPLTTLELGSTTIDDKDVTQIAKCLPSISVLVLNDSKVTDAGIKHVSKMVFLSQLNLSDTAITDSAIDDLAKIKTLQQLDLSGTAITTQGAARFSQLNNGNCKVSHDYD